MPQKTDERDWTSQILKEWEAAAAHQDVRTLDRLYGVLREDPHQIDRKEWIDFIINSSQKYAARDIIDLVFNYKLENAFNAIADNNNDAEKKSYLSALISRLSSLASIDKFTVDTIVNYLYDEQFSILLQYPDSLLSLINKNHSIDEMLQKCTNNNEKLRVIMQLPSDSSLKDEDLFNIINQLQPAQFIEFLEAAPPRLIQQIKGLENKNKIFDKFPDNSMHFNEGAMIRLFVIYGEQISPAIFKKITNVTSMIEKVFNQGEKVELFSSMFASLDPDQKRAFLIYLKDQPLTANGKFMLNDAADLLTSALILHPDLWSTFFESLKESKILPNLINKLSPEQIITLIKENAINNELILDSAARDYQLYDVDNLFSLLLELDINKLIPRIGNLDRFLRHLASKNDVGFRAMMTPILGRISLSELRAQDPYFHLVAMLLNIDKRHPQAVTKILEQNTIHLTLLDKDFLTYIPNTYDHLRKEGTFVQTVGLSGLSHLYNKSKSSAKDISAHPNDASKDLLKLYNKHKKDCDFYVDILKDPDRSHEDKIKDILMNYAEKSKGASTGGFFHHKNIHHDKEVKAILKDANSLGEIFEKLSDIKDINPKGHLALIKQLFDEYARQPMQPDERKVMQQEAQVEAPRPGN